MPNQFIKFEKKIESFLYNRMLLFLSDANQQTVSSELKKKNLQEIRYSGCKWKWEVIHNAESSQCITKFTTDNKQYS